MTTEQEHLQLAKRRFDRGESSAVTGSGVFYKSKNWPEYIPRSTTRNSFKSTNTG